MIDVNSFIGAYPWRPVPGTGPDDLIISIRRLGISEAWVTHLPSLYWKDPAAGNPELYDVAARHAELRPVPVVHPGMPGWEEDLAVARDHRAPAIRCDPGLLALAPAGTEMRSLLYRAGEGGIPVMAAVRLEDGRGRHPLDVAPDLPPWAVRAWLRAAPAVHLVIANADRGFIEEVHWGSTPEESARVWWDLAWVWGPPEDDLRHLLATIGSSRFLFGSGQPLRLPETPLARLDLLDLSPEDRAAITHGNAAVLSGR